MSEGKIRSTWDSDITVTIKDDEMVEQISSHFTLVSRNLLYNILDENRTDKVWIEIIQKLKKSPADFRETLIFMAKHGAFKHKAFEAGYKALAQCSQPDFGNFMSALYTTNMNLT